jgi:hypothetical protein
MFGLLVPAATAGAADVAADRRPTTSVSVTTAATDPSARVLDNVDFKALPLRDALERLRTQAGVNVFVSWTVLERAGVNPEAKVDAKLTNVTLGKVLDLILADAAGGDGRVGWSVDENVVRISTVQDLEHAAAARRDRKDAAEELRLQERLDGPISDVHFDRTPLWQAIETVGDRAGLKIYVPWQLLEDVGVGRSAPVTLSLDHPSAAQALEAVLESGAHDRTRLGFAPRGGVVEVSTHSVLRRLGEARVYDVSDLLSPGGPATKPTARVDGFRSGGNSSVKEFHSADDVAQWLTDTIDPESWREHGGSTGVVRVLHGRFDGTLVVTQTYDNHRQITRVLNRLRDAAAKQQESRK